MYYSLPDYSLLSTGTNYLAAQLEQYFIPISFYLECKCTLCFAHSTVNTQQNTPDVKSFENIHYQLPLKFYLEILHCRLAFSIATIFG